MKQREFLGLKGERIDQYALEKQYKVDDEGISVWEGILAHYWDVCLGFSGR